MALLDPETLVWTALGDHTLKSGKKIYNKKYIVQKQK